MARTSKAVYLGNTDDEYCGFTVGKEYDVHNYESEDNHIGAFADDGRYRSIKNGGFHKFEILDESDCFVTETGCKSIDNVMPSLKFFINGHNVSPEDFEGVKSLLQKLGDDGVKCDTIKLEVKFE